MPPQLTILITTLNRREILEKTLWYIYETSTDEERNLWIWDNASTDDTSDFLGTLVGWPGVRVFRSQKGVGNIEPRRRMIPAVTTPYVFTMDDDWWILNRGWASAVCRVLGTDTSIHQVAVGPCYERHNDYGIAHEHLPKPFFRVPPMMPEGRSLISAADASYVKSGETRPDGTIVIDVAGEFLVVPAGGGTQLPFSCSGGAAAWRTADVRPLLERRTESHPVVDLRESWSFPLQKEQGKREATIIGYGALHPSPGPLWHLGHGEKYWEERCRFAPAVYGRSGEQQQKWLEDTRKASGWGQRLDDPDEVLS